MMYQDGEEQETLYRSELADYEEQSRKPSSKKGMWKKSRGDSCIILTGTDRWLQK